MLTTTTNEHQPLVVAAPIGHGRHLGAAVATTRYRPMVQRAMCDATSSIADDRRPLPASFTFGDWNQPRRPVGFVT